MPQAFDPRFFVLSADLSVVKELCPVLQKDEWHSKVAAAVENVPPATEGLRSLMMDLAKEQIRFLVRDDIGGCRLADVERDGFLIRDVLVACLRTLQSDKSRGDHHLKGRNDGTMEGKEGSSMLSLAESAELGTTRAPMILPTTSPRMAAPTESSGQPRSPKKKHENDSRIADKDEKLDTTKAFSPDAAKKMVATVGIGASMLQPQSQANSQSEDPLLSLLPKNGRHFLLWKGLSTQAFMARRRCDLARDLTIWRQETGKKELKVPERTISEWRRKLHEASTENGEDKPSIGNEPKPLALIDPKLHAVSSLAGREFLSANGYGAKDLLSKATGDLLSEVVAWRLQTHKPTIKRKSVRNKIDEWKREVLAVDRVLSRNLDQQARKDPFLLELDPMARDFLDSQQIVSADDFLRLSQPPKDLAAAFASWRHEHHRSVLGSQGCYNAISSWKKQVEGLKKAVDACSKQPTLPQKRSTSSTGATLSPLGDASQFSSHSGEEKGGLLPSSSPHADGQDRSTAPVHIKQGTIPHREVAKRTIPDLAANDEKPAALHETSIKIKPIGATDRQFEVGSSRDDAQHTAKKRSRPVDDGHGSNKRLAV